MSEFFVKKKLIPYVPGEQPRDRKYIKLNTNESPFPPSKYAIAAAKQEAKVLNLYSDPTAKVLKDAIANYYGVKSSQICVSNGSDEVLAFCFMAFCDNNMPMAFFDITYGFYKVYANLFNIKAEVVNLNNDFTANFEGLKATTGNIIIANPNAQTGIFESLDKIKDLLEAKKDRVVIVDEAYCDFGGESVKSLLKDYDNLILISTFSKSRNLAGGRIGFAVASEKLILDLETIKFSFNPYNLGRLPIAVGKASIDDVDYFKKCTSEIVRVREWAKNELNKLGFDVLPSKANFVLAKCDKIGGEELYLKLKGKGILVRYLGDERIKNYVRITIGSEKQMRALIDSLRSII